MTTATPLPSAPSLALPLRRLAVGWLTAWLAACGGGVASTPPAAEPPPPVIQATQTLGSGGGSVAIDAAALALDAGALTAETVVSLTQVPADAAAGEQMRLQLAPAGQPLAAPATLTVDLPAAPAGTQAFWLVDGDAVLAASTRVGDRFTLRLQSLGFAADGQRLPLAAGRVRPLADGDGQGGDLSLRLLNCQGKVAILSKRLGKLPLSADAMAEAELLSDAVLDAVVQCSEIEAQVIRQDACTQLGSAAEHANLTLPTSLGELTEVIRRLLGAQAMVERAGASCAPATDVQALIAGRISDYLAVLSGQLQRGEFASAAGVRSLRLLFEIEAVCERLELGSACDLLREQMFPDLLDAMRRAAFDDCRERGAALSVAQMLDLGTELGRDGAFLGLARFGTAEVEADLTQCTAPTLAVRVFDTVDGSPQALPGLDTTLTPLKGFANYQRAGALRPPRSGQIVLQGPVAVGRCPDGTAPPADLVVRLADNLREVARRPHNGNRFILDANPIDLSVSALLTAAALDPATATAVSLVVRQEGGACASVASPGKLLLEQPIALFQLDLALATPGQRNRWAGSVTASVEVSATLRGNRVGFDSSFQLNAATETTSEAVDLRMAYGFTLPVQTGTELLPNTRVSLPGAAATGASGSASASVETEYVLTFGGCVIHESGRATLTTDFSNMASSGGTLELKADGQLSIAVGGLRGELTVRSQGENAFLNPCSRLDQTLAFGPVNVFREFTQFQGATTTTTVADSQDLVAGTAVMDRQLLGSEAACQDFLRAHMNRLPTRLVERERVVDCRQRVTLSWQLQRE